MIKYNVIKREGILAIGEVDNYCFELLTIDSRTSVLNVYRGDTHVSIRECSTDLSPAVINNFTSGLLEEFILRATINYYVKQGISLLSWRDLLK